MLDLRPLISASGRCQPGRFLFAHSPAWRFGGTSACPCPPHCPPEGIRNDLAPPRTKVFPICDGCPDAASAASRFRFYRALNARRSRTSVRPGAIMPTYQNATPPLTLSSGDVGFSFNNEAFPGG